MSEVGDLVLAASAGDGSAWDLLVKRFGPLVWSVARAHGLSQADAEDVYQVTWLRLVTHLDTIRDPSSVGGWLRVTTRNESLRLLQRSGRQIPTAGDAGELEPGDDVVPPLDTALLSAERDAELWKALGQLNPKCQRLLRFLADDSEPSYAEVSEALGMPIGSIGPIRRRCLDDLRIALARITDESGGSFPEGGRK